MPSLKKVLPLLFLSSVMMLAFAPAAVAQGSTTGEIRGVVRDPSGALVPGANVKARDIATGWEKSTTSAADGAFVLLSLQAGNYQVTVSAQGFQTSITEGVTVTTGRTTDLPVELKVGSV